MASIAFIHPFISLTRHHIENSRHRLHNDYRPSHQLAGKGANVLQTPEQVQPEENHLIPYLSRPSVWAFSLGATIGWGSLVVTSSSYLGQAGPLGSIIGLLIGTLAMIVIAWNYHYLINCFPSAGGAYTYAKEILGYDYGFLTAWFLMLVYLAVLWANATSLPLFARYFIGDIFKFGYLYSVFKYDIYLGEALLTIAAVLIVAWLASQSKKTVARAMVAMCVILTVAITFCFAYALFARMVSAAPTPMSPAFLPDSSSLNQIITIACISSWAFIGFENVSHFVEEYAFPRRKAFSVMAKAIGCATALYAFVILLSVMAYPPQYANWLEYIRDVGNLSGIEAIPAFYAAQHFLGDAGVWILMAALLCLVLTSLFGNTIALSRLFYALGKDEILSKRYTRLNERNIPYEAVYLVAIVSLPVPFLGRTAIGWIVDVTTIGATTIYALVSIFTRKVSTVRGDAREKVTGTVGLVLMVACMLQLLLPSILFSSSNSLSFETYFIFAVWGILGFLFFRKVLIEDKNRRFGRSVIVWIGLLAIVMFVSFVWTSQSIIDTVGASMDKVVDVACADQPDADIVAFTSQQLALMNRSVHLSTLTGAAMLMVSALLLISNYSHMSQWAQQSEQELSLTKDKLYNDPLTGLPTATHFHNLAEEEATGIWAQGEKPVALEFNLMGMKGFNAKYGRSEGDKLLIAFANVLRNCFGAGSCARTADNNFGAIASTESVNDQVEALFRDFAQANNGLVLPIRAGAYVCRHADDIVSVGFDRARAASGLDRTTWQSHLTWYYESMDDEAQIRLHVLDHLDQAIGERWIRPYYQAVVSATDGHVVEEEALARWIDPESGFLSPGQFIPIVEHAGLLHKLDLHMLDCVLQDMKAKRGLGVPVVPVSINISLHDLGRLDVAQEIIRRVDDARIEHDLLHVEFTESVASQDPAVLQNAMSTLKEAGFEVWMDDFGSGYSSLNTLKDFDFDVVKLDMEFIRGAQTQKTWDIVTGAIAICKKIGLKSLAEGVETEEQAQHLRDAGCDMLQGYLYSRPLPLDDVIKIAQSGEGLTRDDPHA